MRHTPFAPSADPTSLAMSPPPHDSMRCAAFDLAIVACAFALAFFATPLRAEGDFTTSFDRERCTFTSTGSNPYFPLHPGLVLELEGTEEDDEGERIDLEVILSVLAETEIVDGVETRVVEERESEDGELVEVSRNFFAQCRETGDVWYFGEDVDDYEDGVVVGHEGEWRAGLDGATAGVLMPGTPYLGARFVNENAPGVAEDRTEIVALGERVVVPAGTFDDSLEALDTNALDPDGEGDVKKYARGLGLVVDEELELVDFTLPACLPDAATHCLADGRFAVTADWRDFDGGEGEGHAILASEESGEFWFFGAGNTELVVKVLDACSVPGSNAFWVFIGGLTNVEVTVTVTDTESGQVREYDNDLGVPFEPVLDTAAFSACP